MKSIINFFKYNNAVPLILFVALLVVGSALAASQELREAVFSPQNSQNGMNISAPAVLKKTDAAKLLAENFKNYDLALRIDSIKEDTENFYVVYSYRTLEIKDGVWQEIRKTGKMEIPKQLLGKRDLKTYLADQIGQVIDREIAYLSEVQAVLKTPPVQKTSSKYAGLVGKEMEKSKTESDSVKKENEDVAVQTEDDVSPTEEKNTPVGNVVSKEEIREMIVAAVTEFLAVDTSMPAEINQAPQNQAETENLNETAVSEIETQTPELTSQETFVQEPEISQPQE